jgi:hypothetical protein
MPTLEEVCPNDMLQQDRVPLCFHVKMMDFLIPKFPEKFNGRSTSITWSPCLPVINPPPLFWERILRMLCNGPPLTNALEDLARRIRVAVATVAVASTCITTCGLKLNTNMILTGPLYWKCYDNTACLSWEYPQTFRPSTFSLFFSVIIEDKIFWHKKFNCYINKEQCHEY